MNKHKKEYHLKRGDQVTIARNGQIEKFEITKSRNVPTTHGFEPLSIKEALFKTLEMKCITLLFTQEEINFKKNKVKILKIKRA